MITFEAWQRQAEAALGSSAWGEDSHAGLRALAVEARVLWPTLDTGGRAAVLQSLRALQDRMSADLLRTEDELARCGRRRTGVRGYGQLQTSHRGQRLRRRA